VQYGNGPGLYDLRQWRLSECLWSPSHSSTFRGAIYARPATAEFPQLEIRRRATLNACFEPSSRLELGPRPPCRATTWRARWNDDRLQGRLVCWIFTGQATTVVWVGRDELLSPCAG